LNIDYYIKKKHVFKHRTATNYYTQLMSLQKKYSVYTPKNIRLEFVYIKLFRRLLRRKYVKGRIKLFKPRYWLYLLPNYILTQKSKNSRMGAGVGKLVRLVNIKYSDKVLIKTWRYTFTFIRGLVKYLYFKLSILCYIR
jgi:ribosomal protein L16/L10AE